MNSRHSRTVQNVISHIDVGQPPSSRSSDQKSFVFHIHDFENLPSQVGDAVPLQTIFALGHKWKLKFFPGGSRDFGGVFLHLKNFSEIRIYFLFRISVFGTNDEEVKFLSRPSSCGREGKFIRLFSSRERALENLHEGTLRFNLVFELNDKTGNLSQEFVPSNPLSSVMLQSLSDKESADIVFEFNGSDKGTGDDKKIKTTSTLHSHRFVLERCAPVLATLCESFERPVVVPIDDVTPEIFLKLLQYIYGGEISDDEMKENSTKIIDAADKYGVVHLKLQAEQWFVKNTTIAIENVLDLLHYADSKNCALLKEAVMDFIVENGHEVLQKVSTSEFPGNIGTDLLTAMARGKANNNNQGGRGDQPDYSIMRVNALRKMCHEKGLSVDGSRESMIASLQNAEKDND